MTPPSIAEGKHLINEPTMKERMQSAGKAVAAGTVKAGTFVVDKSKAAGHFVAEKSRQFAVCL